MWRGGPAPATPKTSPPQPVGSAMYGWTRAILQPDPAAEGINLKPVEFQRARSLCRPETDHGLSPEVQSGVNLGRRLTATAAVGRAAWIRQD